MKKTKLPAVLNWSMHDMHKRKKERNISKGWTRHSTGEKHDVNDMLSKATRFDN